MRKFSSILENKDELLGRLSISDEDIEEIFVDLTDKGYELLIDSIYISLKTGEIFYDKNDVKYYYPGIEIKIDRFVDEKSTDYRNWDGSVYYENDITILDEINSAIHRLKSEFGDKSSIYYSFKNINLFTIRLVFDKEESESPLDKEKVKDVIRKLNTNDAYNDPLDIGTSIEGYSIKYDNTWRSSHNNHEYEISLNTRVYGDIDITRPNLSSSEQVIKGNILNGKDDNKEQITSIFNAWCRKFFDEIKNDNLRLIPTGPSSPSGESRKGYKIIYSNGESSKDLITIYYNIHNDNDYKVQTEPKSIKNYMRGKFIKFEVYTIYFKIKILEW